MVLSGEQEGPSSITQCGAVECGEVKCGEVKCGEYKSGEVKCREGKCGAGPDDLNKLFLVDLRSIFMEYSDLWVGFRVWWPRSTNCEI